MNLSSVDLNLLVAFDALVAERSVTRAAKRLGLSQPAASNALRRLRDLLDDPVLVRAGSSMVPTERALELAPAVPDALSTARRALSPSRYSSLAPPTPPPCGLTSRRSSAPMAQTTGVAEFTDGRSAG